MITLFSILAFSFISLLTLAMRACVCSLGFLPLTTLLHKVPVPLEGSCKPASVEASLDSSSLILTDCSLTIFTSAMTSSVRNSWPILKYVSNLIHLVRKRICHTRINYDKLNT
ncbi:hypothetical protein BpHYR1_053880 [Brachionus plicatilis]|uniref:Secreted protein n=1 Tax=Brachionus plicatilis TaxID=10195 RepID=A0A3M7RW70_BRAPC|nr:hypothetical protein BpHYR1_053880 [Brachionus plicatilis]